ncbi:hypothetical protein BDY19DRAFT_923533 [Irpex rosettiformis]|uniref:Uncharacterized protein n=1 Tax=Irpex rosettiformis TaxID=378272 RepID=A0ACB8UGM2_9APHY|nr:hypothetical protein BDY19DRAFT_923533 [Irpex rosettiformis]
MADTVLNTTSTTLAALDPVSTSISAVGSIVDDVPAHHANPIVAFIIGLGIVTLASLMNAAGLNLTKLDHVRTSAIPKAERKHDWLRPLWLLGMVLYIISQLIGSTLALQYMRAEYVAPLGSTSLIFNFLFAKFLVNTPVTNHDIYGTIIVIIGVIGIVAFGSINSGLAQETDAKHLTHLWTRGNWLAYFFFMTFSLFSLYTFTSQLEAVLAARSDLSALPFGSVDMRAARPTSRNILRKIKSVWNSIMLRVRIFLESWTASHDDKRIAWTLGIGWACCGGGLAGGCLVFAKAGVQLISGSLSRENTGNQFGQASSIFTFIFLAVTAVFQIICLNRGLKAYDSTLVVPVFYGVYTATGFLDSLIFNDEVDAYQSWTLFLIFCAILILVSGVVLLTNKKPEPKLHGDVPGGEAQIALPSRARRRTRNKGVKATDEEEGLRDDDDDDAVGEDPVVWELGEASDDEDEPPTTAVSPRKGLLHTAKSGEPVSEERTHMLAEDDAEHEGLEHRESTSSDATLARPEAEEEFGDWNQSKGAGNTHS